MHSIISKLNLLVIFNVTFCCAAISYVTHPTINQPSRLPSSIHLGEAAPTCIPIDLSSQTLRVNIHFDNDCLGAWGDILSMDEFAYTAWRWKRIPPDRLLPEGYARLPFIQVHNTCLLKLDVLDQPSDDERLALAELGPALKELWAECLQPKKGLLAMGVIRVGHFQNLALTAQPSQMRLSLPALNHTAK